jgi:CheY-like chemotaxis protein
MKRLPPVLRALVVEDDHFTGEALCSFLRLCGWSGEAFESTSMAENRLREGNFDLILTDYYMDDVNGVEFLQRVRTTGIDLPAILMSGHAWILRDAPREALGIRAVLLKPFTVEALACAVRQAVGSSEDI